TNHVGDSRFFNLQAAQAAISTTNNAFGCGNGFDPGSINCAITAGAHIADFAANGLDSGYMLCSGIPCGLQGLPDAAFPGINKDLGGNEMLFPIGRSVYNGLQMTLKQELSNPTRGIKHVNLQVSYSLSKYVATARDNDFSTAATDFANPNHYMGPTGLDR